MNELLSFYKVTNIKPQDQSALEKLGVKDLSSLFGIKQSICQKQTPSVSLEAQGKLRALIHYLDYHEHFDKDQFETHLLLEEMTLKQKVISPKKQNSKDNEVFVFPTQGFDPSSEGEEEIDDTKNEVDVDNSDLEEVDGFKRGFCYHHRKTSNTVIVVGIRSFVVEETRRPTKANCVMIIPASQTFLGQGQNEHFEVYSSRHVQVWTEQSVLLLSELTDTCPAYMKQMPKICYKPQKQGSIRSFGYFYDSSCINRIGIRENDPKVIELFCGSGGMHLGYKANNFETVKAVDLNPDAIKTFRVNNPEDSDAVECTCVNEYLKTYKRNSVVEVLHASSPCQGFSKANRNGGKNDKINNELALSFTEGLRRTEALIGIFENVSR